MVLQPSQRPCVRHTVLAWGWDTVVPRRAAESLPPARAPPGPYAWLPRGGRPTVPASGQREEWHLERLFRRCQKVKGGKGLFNGNFFFF